MPWPVVTAFVSLSNGDDGFHTLHLKPQYAEAFYNRGLLACRPQEEHRGDRPNEPAMRIDPKIENMTLCVLKAKLNSKQNLR